MLPGCNQELTSSVSSGNSPTPSNRKRVRNLLGMDSNLEANPPHDEKCSMLWVERNFKSGETYSEHESSVLGGEPSNVTNLLLRSPSRVQDGAKRMRVSNCARCKTRRFAKSCLFAVAFLAMGAKAAWQRNPMGCSLSTRRRLKGAIVPLAKTEPVKPWSGDLEDFGQGGLIGGLIGIGDKTGGNLDGNAVPGLGGITKNGDTIPELETQTIEALPQDFSIKQVVAPPVENNVVPPIASRNDAVEWDSVLVERTKNEELMSYFGIKPYKNAEAYESPRDYTDAVPNQLEQGDLAYMEISVSQTLARNGEMITTYKTWDGETIHFDKDLPVEEYKNEAEDSRWFSVICVEVENDNAKYAQSLFRISRPTGESNGSATLTYYDSEGNGQDFQNTGDSTGQEAFEAAWEDAKSEWDWDVLSNNPIDDDEFTITTSGITFAKGMDPYLKQLNLSDGNEDDIMQYVIPIVFGALALLAGVIIIICLRCRSRNKSPRIASPESSESMPPLPPFSYSDPSAHTHIMRLAPAPAQGKVGMNHYAEPAEHIIRGTI